MSIAEIRLYRADLPLISPYRLSYRTFESFEPILVEARDSDGRIGWGEQHISPGSSAETREGGWAFVNELADAMIGKSVADAKALVIPRIGESKVAASALITALEMLEEPAILESPKEKRVRLLTAFSAMGREEIADDVEKRIEEGFRTFKIKVGKDVAADLERVAWIQSCVAGRVTLRLDANRAFSKEQGCEFAQALDPNGIELFEQPCDDKDWDANAAVAAVSKVPLMLDEPICTLDDIDRAAGIDGVGLCKVKLKRFGSLENLREAIERVHAKGLKAVLGDGLGAEINSWMEGCIADGLINNAGEFNGYIKIKPEHRLLANPLPFDDGELIVPAAWTPQMDRDRLEQHLLTSTRHAVTAVAS